MINCPCYNPLVDKIETYRHALTGSCWTISKKLFPQSLRPARSVEDVLMQASCLRYSEMMKIFTSNIAVNQSVYESVWRLLIGWIVSIWCQWICADYCDVGRSMPIKCSLNMMSHSIRIRQTYNVDQNCDNAAFLCLQWMPTFFLSMVAPWNRM